MATYTKLLLFLVFLCVWTSLSLAVRYGAPAKTLHFHRSSLEQSLGRNMYVINAGDADDAVPDVLRRAKRQLHPSTTKPNITKVVRFSFIPILNIYSESLTHCLTLVPLNLGH